MIWLKSTKSINNKYKQILKPIKSHGLKMEIDFMAFLLIIENGHLLL
jgi:hypothetical protein